MYGGTPRLRLHVFTCELSQADLTRCHYRHTERGLCHDLRPRRAGLFIFRGPSVVGCQRLCVLLEITVQMLWPYEIE